MNSLTSYRQWKPKNLKEADENLHSGAAMSDYKSGFDSDINLESETENQIYAAYLDRIETRIEKHKDNYESYLEGGMSVEDFVHDIALTRRLFEDWDAYAQRLEKLCQVEGKKKSDGKR